MTSQLFFEVRFCHNQLENPKFGQITELQVTKIESVKGAGGEEPSELGDF